MNPINVSINGDIEKGKEVPINHYRVETAKYHGLKKDLSPEI